MFDHCIARLLTPSAWIELAALLLVYVLACYPLNLGTSRTDRFFGRFYGPTTESDGWMLWGFTVFMAMMAFPHAATRPLTETCLAGIGTMIGLFGLRFYHQSTKMPRGEP